MLKILRQDKNAQILVVTPLLTGHQIFKQTKISLERSGVPIIWTSYEGEGKHATNVQANLDAYKEKYKSFPPYIQILDRDIILGRNYLDKMLSTIEKSGGNIGFVYSPFEYKGYINVTFPPRIYDINFLMNNNYISSNSLYKSEAIERVGGFVTDIRIHRLSDWAMWLKMYKFGYIGQLCSNAFFTAISSPTDISAGSKEEFIEVRKLVIEEYVKPILAQK
jgi:hypothetical protein